MRLGTVTLTELDDAAGAADDPRARRRGRAGAGALPRRPARPGPLRRRRRDPATPGPPRPNLAHYLGYCGATGRRPARGAGRSARPPGPRRPGRRGRHRPRPPRRRSAGSWSGRACSLWLELSFDGPARCPACRRPIRPRPCAAAWSGSTARGSAVGSAYHPLHPEVREAMRRRVVEALTRSRTAPRRQDPALAAGLLIRLGPGPTLLGTPDTGVDDATFARFVRETFSPETARERPGPGDRRPGPVRRAAALSRRRGPDALADLAVAGDRGALRRARRGGAGGRARRRAGGGDARPGRRPGRRRGAAGRPGRADPSQAWRSVGLDLQAWPSGPVAPAVFRGVSLSTDALAHDLATSPDLDAMVAGRPRRGLLLTVDGGPRHAGRRPASRRRAPASRRPIGPTRRPERRTSIWLSALPLGDGPAADEPLGHALAALDARGSSWRPAAVAGHEERLRRFAGVLRACPPGRRARRACGRPPCAALRRRRPEASGDAAPDLPGDRQRLALSDPAGLPARGPGAAVGRGPRPRPPPGARPPRPAAGTWSSTCSPSASRRSGSGRRGSRSRR